VSPVSIRPVEGRKDLNAFIELPYRLRSDEPQWVPPLRFERRAFLDRTKNPWFEHAEAEFFLCERDGQVVGRISAHVDHRWDEFQGGNDGMFGFIEAVDDPEVFSALLDAASDWLRERGRERMLGPMDFTMNDECGVLVEGFDEPTMILEPWHPPYYGERLDSYGLSKEIDLFMYELYFGQLKAGDEFHPLIHSAAEHAREKGVTVRNMRRRDMKNEVTRFMEVYNEAWGRNWGFVPITEAEVEFQAKNLKPILDENWAMIAELDGKVVGAGLTLPDINQALARMNGRILPFGWWHFLRRRSYIDRLRVFALGVLSDYQHYGVAAALYVRHMETAARPDQISGGHTGWILETNEAMNRAMEGMGGRVTKRYRMYRLPLQTSPA
jgi:GNAT superfamily N-acetyltransferase